MRRWRCRQPGWPRWSGRHAGWKRALASNPFQIASGQLFAGPYSPLLDFDATAADAEWIDALAGAALKTREGLASDRVIAHTDGFARNVRFNDERVLVVNDWSSLAFVSGTHAVGIAAATWSSGGPRGLPIAPWGESALLSRIPIAVRVRP